MGRNSSVRLQLFAPSASLWAAYGRSLRFPLSAVTPSLQSRVCSFQELMKAPSSFYVSSLLSLCYKCIGPCGSPLYSGGSHRLEGPTFRLNTAHPQTLSWSLVSDSLFALPSCICYFISSTTIALSVISIPNFPPDLLMKVRNKPSRKGLWSLPDTVPPSGAITPVRYTLY